VCVCEGVCLCVRVCVCVRERERERESESCLCVCLCVGMGVLLQPSWGHIFAQARLQVRTPTPTHAHTHSTRTMSLLRDCHIHVQFMEMPVVEMRYRRVSPCPSGGWPLQWRPEGCVHRRARRLKTADTCLAWHGLAHPWKRATHKHLDGPARQCEAAYDTRSINQVYKREHRVYDMQAGQNPSSVKPCRGFWHGCVYGAGGGCCGNEGQ
jgi:hypothetical protein